MVRIHEWDESEYELEYEKVERTGRDGRDTQVDVNSENNASP